MFREYIDELREKGNVVGLTYALRAGDWRVRSGAAEALGEIGDSRAVEPLIIVLEDKEEDVRWRAAYALGKIGEPAVDPLIAALGDEDGDVRRRAADVLGMIGEPAINPLITALGDEDSDVRKNVAYALGKIGYPAVEPLITALREGNSSTRRGAAEALGEIGDVSAIVPLIVAIDDADWYVRWNAIDALGKIADPKTVSAIEKATNDSDERVIGKAREVLDTIKSSDAYKDYLKEQALKKAYEETSAIISPIGLETSKLKLSGVNVQEAEKLLEQAKTRLDENDFEQAKELANRASKVANERKEKYDLAVKPISETEEIVSRVRAEGVVVSDELLTKSKESLSDGDYEIAIKLAEEQKNLVMNRETRYREAMEHMKSAESVIRIVEGLGCEISSTLGLLKEANSAFGNGNYEEAIEYANQCRDTVERVEGESKPEITLKFPEWVFKPNTWKRTEITITNTGSMHAKGIKIEPSGDIEFRRMSTIPRLERDETERMTIFMKPTVMGDVPIDITITFKDVLDQEYTSSKDMWVMVAESMSMSESISINESPLLQGRSEPRYQVALSYAGEDRRYAEGLAELLKEKGISLFYDKYEQANLWGKDLYQHLQSVYRDKAQYCVVFLSQAYAQKLWTRHELESAQARAFRERREYILPVKIDDTEIPGINETIGYNDLRLVSLEEIADMLVTKLSSQNPKE